jgi:hypothetical protein
VVLRGVRRAGVRSPTPPGRGGHGYESDTQWYAKRINFPVADPWYDYLAIPIAPLILLLQLASIFFSDRRVRWTVGPACVAALIVMFLYVASIDVAPDEGANIGAGVMLLWILCSVALLAAAVVREVVAAVARRLTRPRGTG